MNPKDRIKIIKELEKIITKNNLRIGKLNLALQELNQDQEQMSYTLVGLKKQQARVEGEDFHKISIEQTEVGNDND